MIEKPTKMGNKPEICNYYNLHQPSFACMSSDTSAYRLSADPSYHSTRKSPDHPLSLSTYRELS